MALDLVTIDQEKALSKRSLSNSFISTIYVLFKIRDIQAVVQR